MNEFSETDDVLFASAFTYAPIGMAIVAPDGTWLKVNSALCSIVGYSPQELMAKTFQDITHPDDLGEDLRFVNQVLSGEIDTYQMEKRYFHKLGHIIHVLLSVSLVKNDDSPRFFISQIQDITQQKKMESELARMAREDELTKVFNRRFFMELVTRELVRGSRFREPQAILMIDIDHFKKVNDKYGHAVGDEVLRMMADECSRSLRSVDVFGRLGGEEFGVLLLNTDSEVAMMLAERLRKKVEGLIVKNSKGDIGFTISIGLTAFTAPKLSLEELLKKADEALYEAKETGRNKTVKNSVDESVDSSDCLGMRTSFIRLKWKKEYESGCQIIDRQHQNLFVLSNDLLAAIISGLPDDQVNSLAEDLMEHTAKHFRDEEAIYRKVGFPGAETHSRIHHSLIQDMQTVIEKFRKNQVSVAELFDLIAIKIVQKHMFLEDRKFFSYLDSAEEC